MPHVLFDAPHLGVFALPPFWQLNRRAFAREAPKINYPSRHRMEAIVIEQVILGIFLAIPLLIVAVMFTDELWEEHRQRHPRDAGHEH
jgi:hypothetical protein